MLTQRDGHGGRAISPREGNVRALQLGRGVSRKGEGAEVGFER